MEEEDGIRIVPLPKNLIQEFRGMLKDYPLVEDLLESRREEALNEEHRARMNKPQ